MNDLGTECMGVDLVCPVCKGTLDRGEGLLSCQKCGKEWRAPGGIADLRLSPARYWGEYPEDVMDRLVARCREAGWNAALKEFFLERDPQYYDYTLDKRRADWHLLVPIGRESRILDAGCGWGTLSFALAGVYREVVALDAVRQRVEFIDIRSKSEGLKNLTPVCGQVGSLPFPDGYFDLVVLNGVLEWVPMMEEGVSPATAQMGALKEVLRVLKKGGYLYLAIENRWAAINFLGFKDTHSGLRFVTLMPRFLANIYSRAVRGKDFREYTWTYWEHRRMLRKAGFSDARFYAPLPTYRRFYYMLPIKDSSKIKFFLRSMAFPRNDMQRFFILAANSFFLYKIARYFVPDFSIVARR
ncbi:MAG: class I SAM-dependent methyltransferase [Candidatus Omnitrophica bacterium]|nr:class I SAM-dependent methyltransferase [Candidatus Omnitrophota bacterium]